MKNLKISMKNKLITLFLTFWAMAATAQTCQRQTLPHREQLSADRVLYVMQDSEGYLCLSTSGRILGENGEIYLGNDDFVIDVDGRIYQNGEYVDRLRLSYIPPDGNIDKFGVNMFTSEDATDIPEDAKFDIIQGAYERSNIDLNYEMTMMMNTNRIYEASSAILKLCDSMNQRAATLCKLNS